MLHSEQISHQPNLCQYNSAKDNKKDFQVWKIDFPPFISHTISEVYLFNYHNFDKYLFLYY